MIALLAGSDLLKLNLYGPRFSIGVPKIYGLMHAHSRVLRRRLLVNLGAAIFDDMFFGGYAHHVRVGWSRNNHGVMSDNVGWI